MCDWGWVPRFALKYVELVGVCLLGMGFTCFASEVGSAMRLWMLGVEFSAGGGCVVDARGIAVWGSGVALTGFFRWVLC